MHTLDAIDRKILGILQTDSRTTMQELADKVGLSVSPCHRRVKLMEERGVITRYIATVDQKSLGLHVSVFISIKLARQKEEDLNRFAKAISKWDEVLECYLMTGNRDYLLRVVAADLSSYEAFLKNKLTRLDGIASIEVELCAEPGEILDRAAGVRTTQSPSGERRPIEHSSTSTPLEPSSRGVGDDACVLGRRESRHTPRLLSRQPPPASRQFSFRSSTGGPQGKGARSKFSARQSPSSQSALACHSGNVVAISHSAPELRKFATARAILAKDRCTRQSRHRMASHSGNASRVISPDFLFAARPARSISGGTMSTPTYRTPRSARLIQPASPQGASSSEVTPSLSRSRGNSARSTAVAPSRSLARRRMLPRPID